MGNDSRVFRPNQIQYTMTKEQKKAVGILSLGTILEYFDLMLYVHMAVVLNDLFFPKTDPHTAKLLAGFTFCSTYVFRPFGALFFGWLGDKVGRRYTIILTTAMMAVACIIMAKCETYAEIGISASIIMIGCRVLQGLASMGEVVGALLYLTESIERPVRYFAVGLIESFCNVGCVLALVCANLSIGYMNDWRIAFYIGATLAIISIVVRVALRETPEFLDASKKLQEIKEIVGDLSADNKHFLSEQFSVSHKKSYYALFCLECVWPLAFYFIYVFCADLLKNQFGYTNEQIINHNLILTIILLLTTSLNSILYMFFHPMIIFKYRFILSLGVFCAISFCLNNISSSFDVMVIQTLILLFSPYSLKGMASTIYTHFPVLKRFRAASIIYAASRAATYVVTTFGFIYLVQWLGNLGIFLAFVFTSLCTWYGFNHFWKLEKVTGDLEKFARIQKVAKDRLDTTRSCTIAYPHTEIV